MGWGLSGLVALETSKVETLKTPKEFKHVPSTTK
jgi:hypothetical protein